MRKSYRATICALLICVGVAGGTPAQPGGRYLDTEARLLDRLLPLESEPAPFFLRMAMRFSDSASQLVIVVRPGGASELLEYTVEGMGDNQLLSFIARQVAENPAISDQDIAAKLHVTVRRSAVDYGAISPWLKKLQSVRTSPALTHRVGTDAVSQYEFWYDTWQEAVHYSLIGPFNGGTQDSLTKWMIDFRAHIGEISKPAPESKR